MSAHRFTGWPGAYCLDCGAEDAWETALALEWYDPYTEIWDTPEHKALPMTSVSNCPGPPRLDKGWSTTRNPGTLHIHTTTSPEALG